MTSEDTRVRRTRVALTEALFRLLERDGFETINVSDLCKEAGVHRTTFYGHASSIEEFAVAVVSREIDEWTTVIVGPHEDPREAYRLATQELLGHMIPQRPAMRTLLKSQFAGVLALTLELQMRNRMEIGLDYMADLITLPTRRRAAVAYTAAGIVGFLLDWAQTDDTDTYIAGEQLHALMPGWWPIKARLHEPALAR